MKKIKIIIFSITIISTILFFSKINFFTTNKHFLNNTWFYVVKPVGTIFSSVGYWSRHKLSSILSIGQIKKNNQHLFDENILLKIKIAKLQLIEKENKNFRQELSLMPRKKYNLIPALVIGRESGNYSEIVYINKGKKNGVKNGMVILVNKGILVGQIIDLTDTTAKVKLIIDKDFRVNAKIIESNGKGIVRGQFGTSALMEMIPQTVKLKKGDTIVSSELSATIPANLLIGYVQNIGVTADNLFQVVTITFPIDFDYLHLVWILVSQKNEK